MGREKICYAVKAAGVTCLRAFALHYVNGESDFAASVFAVLCGVVGHDYFLTLKDIVLNNNTNADAKSTVDNNLSPPTNQPCFNT